MQPGNVYNLNNTFKPFNGENIIQVYECREGCSKCCGPTTTIALTANRIISRYKKPNGCCGCIKGGHIDTTIFMRDIEVIKEAKGKTWGLWLTVFFSIITCTWPFFLCALCFQSCCDNRGEILEVKGAFGSELLTFDKAQVNNAAMNISGMVMPFKNPPITGPPIIVGSF